MTVDVDALVKEVNDNSNKPLTQVPVETLFTDKPRPVTAAVAAAFTQSNTAAVYELGKPTGALHNAAVVERYIPLAGEVTNKPLDWVVAYCFHHMSSRMFTKIMLDWESKMTALHETHPDWSPRECASEAIQQLSEEKLDKGRERLDA